MSDPRSYGRAAPSTFGRKADKRESWPEYKARTDREDRERTAYFQKVARLMQEGRAK